MLLLAPAAQLASGSCARRAVCTPEFKQRGKLRLRVIEGRAFGRTLAEANIGYAQAGDDGQQFALCVKALALEQRSAQTRIERQPRHGPTPARDTAIVIEGLQLLQQAIPVVERARIRRIDKWKILCPPQTIRGEAQQQRREVGAQDFWLREGRAPLKVFFAVQPHAQA